MRDCMVYIVSVRLQDEVVATSYQYSYKINISPDLKQVHIYYVDSVRLTSVYVW